LQEISDDPSVLDDGRFWAVVITFEGAMTFARFENVFESSFPETSWEGFTSSWNSSLSRNGYIKYVDEIRSLIANGTVYQVNACYEMVNSAADSEVDLSGLFTRLLKGNPAPFAQYLKIPTLEIASASPERFLSRQGNLVLTSPIKGTIRGDKASFGEKDKAENLMIVDLMRNDLGKICADGSVEVSELFRSEVHPGLTHLVSDVQGTLREGITWREIFEALTPPGSVSGAPKSSALTTISDNEGVARGVYCGAIGWVEGDRAELAVGIRTFWKGSDSVVRFGTGAGITWGSDPLSEWEETQLKAEKLIAIAGGEIK
ncbi:MAG: anthranilate synthase component I family protein, partial [Actinobacteria bacterium]|nr:anthranilate synthase component I family protein [Actinomycetota bacterium]